LDELLARVAEGIARSPGTCRPRARISGRNFEFSGKWDLMYTIGYFIIALATVLNMILMLYFWIVIARAVLSWVSPDPYNPIVRFIHAVTEPVLLKIRSRLPLYFSGFDFTPIVVLAAIYFIKIFVVQTLIRFGNSLL
jgi:YggT family protein